MNNKLAIIGCGGIGSYHLSHFLQFEDIELVGFCDLILERADQFVENAGKGMAFTEYVEMLDAVQPDMVFICVPPSEHGAIEFELVQRGIHFFVEKPLALDLELAREIRDAAEEANVITASGFQVRYSNLVEPNMQFIDEHEIVFIDCLRMGGIPGVPWWINKTLSGGQIVEQTIHQFDIIRYVFGEPVEVFTMATRGFVTDVENYDTDDLTTTLVRFENGALATISTGCYATGANAADNKLVFGSRDARAELRILNDLVLFGVDDDESSESADTDAGLVVGDDGGMYATEGGEIVYKDSGDAGLRCDRTFIDAVLSGDPSQIRSSYADAMRSLAFTLACNESIETGLPVTIKHL